MPIQEINSIKEFNRALSNSKDPYHSDSFNTNPVQIFDGVKHKLPEWVTDWCDLSNTIKNVPDERLEIFFELMHGKLIRYISDEIVFNTISGGLKPEKFNLLFKHLILDITSIKEWSKVSNYCSSEEMLNMLADIMQTQAAQFVSSEKDLRDAIDLLRFPSVSRVSTFLNTMADKLPGLMTSKEVFNKTAAHIPLECFPTFLRIMQTQLPQFIDSAESLFVLINSLPIRKELNVLLDFIQDKLPQLITSLQDVNRVIESLPNRFHFSEKSAKEQYGMVFSRMKENLPQLITSVEDFQILAKYHSK